MRSPAALLVVSALSWLVAGCRGDRCSPSDLECFLDHMVLAEPRNEGALLPLTEVWGQLAIAPPPGCSTDACDGTCVNLAFDDENCGSCGARCEGGRSCAGGVCACPAGKETCNGVCVDTATDPLHCGSCGVVCSAGKCSGGSCVTACEPEKTTCKRSCVDVDTDPNNCGQCGRVCAAGESCVAGVCACESPPFECGCIDPAHDPANCGGCGVVCAADETCAGGVCAAKSPPPPTVASITSQLPPFQFEEPSELQPISLVWSDPNGCGPAFCFHLCDQSRCSDGYQCVAPGDDPRAEGSFRAYLGFLANPSPGSAELRGGVVPISAPGCPADLLTRVSAGDASALAGVGAERTFGVTIGEGSSIDPPAPDETRCSAPVSACSCSVRACETPAGKCFYEMTVGRVECGPGCDCAEASSLVLAVCCPAP